MNMLRLSIAAIVTALSLVFVQVQIHMNSLASTNSVEQDEIQSTIEAYFENRYRGMSILQLEGFENLTEQLSDGDTFLSAELDKLEIEIQHAKYNRLRYSQYEFFLNFKSLSINTLTQVATVSVVEGHDVVFEISEVISPVDPIISSMRNLEHTIVLHKVQGEWKIVSDYYEDYLWRLIRATGLSADELLQSMIESQNQPLSENGIQIVTSCSLPADESTHPYNRSGAVVYAHRWATAAPPYNHPPYDDFTNLGGDCTNFVSQAIHEGGNAPMVYYSDCGENCVGTLGWFYVDVNHRANAWNNVTALHDFINQYLVWPRPGIDDPDGPGGPEGCDVSKDSAHHGDIIQYEWEGGAVWDHSVIIVDSLDMGNGDMYHLVAGHTPDVDNYPFNLFNYGDASKIYRFIRIERIDGYVLVYLPLDIKNSGGTAMSQPQPVYQNPYPAPMENIQEPVQMSPYPAP